MPTPSDARAELLAAVENLPKRAYREVLDCVLRGKHDARSAIGDFALNAADILKDRLLWGADFPALLAAVVQQAKAEAIANYIDDHGITCDCCQHVMIDVTAEKNGGESHCTAGDPEGDGIACAHGMYADLELRLQQAKAEQRREDAERFKAFMYAQFYYRSDHVYSGVQIGNWVDGACAILRGTEPGSGGEQA